MARVRNPILFLVALAAVVAGAIWQRLDHSQASATKGPRAAIEARGEATAVPATIPDIANPSDGGSAASAVDQLAGSEAEKEQVLLTLALIESEGPFPYQKDGATFANREGRLPKKPRGYYREYTVPTPGASNRGARRIVRGQQGETYYTRDHYGTFVRLDE